VLPFAFFYDPLTQVSGQPLIQYVKGVHDCTNCPFLEKLKKFLSPSYKTERSPRSGITNSRGDLLTSAYFDPLRLARERRDRPNQSAKQAPPPSRCLFKLEESGKHARHVQRPS
jgi:hypothetical protein